MNYSGGFFLTNLVTNFKIEDIPTRDPNLKPTSRNKDSNKYITINKVVYICLSVREAVATVSVGVGQGYVKCMCTGKCQCINVRVKLLIFLVILNVTPIRRLVV